MNEVYEIYSYGSGELLALIFNGVAMITKDGAFLSLAKIAMLIAFIWVLGGAAFNMKLVNSFVWLIGAIVVVFVMLFPKVNVAIVDRIDPSNNQQIANVPLGLGIPAAAVSQIGDYLTQTFETVFTLPGDLTYSKNGMLFGQRLIEATSRLNISDARTLVNLGQFFNNCVLFDVALERYTWSDLQNTSNLKEFLSGKTSRIIRYNHTLEDGSNDLLVCRTSISDGGEMAKDIEAEYERVSRRTAYQLFGTKRTQAGSDLVRNELMQVSGAAYHYLANLSQNSAEVMRQSVMINAIRDASLSVAVMNDSAAAASSYAVARAEKEREATWKTMGEMALRTLPMLRGILEAILYAVFPIVVIMALMAPKQAVSSYLKAMVWLQLWAPLYAVLHLAISVYSTNAGVVAGASSGVNMSNLDSLGEAMSTMGYVAGYLSVSLPMIAWMMVNQGGMMMASLAGGVMQGMQGIASRAADEAVTGNISMGQFAQDNINSFKNDTTVSNLSGTAQHNDHSGNIFSVDASGGKMMNNPISANLSGTVESNVNTQAGITMKSALTDLENVAELRQDSHQKSLALGEKITEATNNGHSFNKTDMDSYERSSTEMKEIANDFAKKFGYDEKEAMAAALALSASVSGGFEFLGNGVKTSMAGELKGTTNATSNEGVEEQIKYLEKSGFNEAFKANTSAAHSIATQINNGAEDTWAAQAMDTFTATNQSQESLAASFETANSWAELKSHIDKHGATVGIDAGEAVRNYINDQVGIPVANELLSKARSGDTEALGVVNSLANDWVRSQDVQALAGMVGAPSESDVMAANAENKRLVANGGIDHEEEFNSRGGSVADKLNTGKQDVLDQSEVTMNAVNTHGHYVAANLNAGEHNVDTQGDHLAEHVRGDLREGSTWGNKTGTVLGNNVLVGSTVEGVKGLGNVAGEFIDNPVSRDKAQAPWIEQQEANEGGKNFIKDMKK